MYWVVLFWDLGFFRKILFVSPKPSVLVARFTLVGANATLSIALEFSLHMSAMNLSPYLLEIPELL